ncbi:MAG TPA: GNAT family N-acetyltransferase, partial [Thermoanaerobaculia bacterium]|nr:GNAT family N-acetyltransferase [Thermoanaerobaculia bacterium]
MREVAALALENFRVHATFPSRGIPAARIEESGALTWLDSGLDTDTFNLVLGARLDGESVPARAAEVVAHFAKVRRPFSWWVSPGDRPGDLGERLVAAGLALEERELAMSCPLDRLRPAARASALEIQRVATPEALAEFARVSAENWTPPDDRVERYYARAAGRLLETGAPLRFYLARREGTAVAAVEIAASAGTLGVYNLSTRLAHRNAGIGGALLRVALGEQRTETGASLAVLQAAPAASGLYRR